MERATTTTHDSGLHEVRRTIARWMIVASAGSVIALVGVVVFLNAHEITTPAAPASYDSHEQQLHEVLWAAFGIALLLAGALVAAIGLMSWCRDDATPR